MSYNPKDISEYTPEHIAQIDRNIERAGEFVKYLIENPSEWEKIPNGSHIHFADIYEKMDHSRIPDEAKGKILLIKKVYEFT